jgi:Response regulator containing CheY-like receiver, AAA-type ATPase, and DNA-binding domains
MLKRQTIGNIPTVLIVDDEADILELLEITLLRMGLDVVKATCVAEALTSLQQGEFGLCLTDMRLPDGDGLEIALYPGRAADCSGGGHHRAWQYG